MSSPASSSIVAERRRFGVIGRWRFRVNPNNGFGLRSDSVLDDVGVRFGGSEHHRIWVPPRISITICPVSGSEGQSLRRLVDQHWGRMETDGELPSFGWSVNRAVSGNGRKATAAVMRYGC
jgi:hypothetical protein